MRRVCALVMVAVCLSAQPLYAYDSNVIWGVPGGGGGISGSGANTRVTFWTGAFTLGSDADWTFASDVMTLNGQGVFTGNPAGPAFTQATVTINPATSAGGEFFFSVGDNGTRRFSIDKEGDAVFGDATTDATGLWWDNVNNTLGMGFTPASAIAIYGTRNSAFAQRLVTYSNTAATTSSLTLAHAGGTTTAPAVTGTGWELGVLRFSGAPNTVSAAPNTSIAIGARILGMSTEVWSSTAAGARMDFETVLNTTGTLVKRMIIDNTGFVGIGPDPVPDATLDVQGTTEIGGNVTPDVDNTYDIGTAALRIKTLHLGPASLVVHNDATNTQKVSLDFSGANAARLVTDATTTLQLTTGANSGITVSTAGNTTNAGNFVNNGNTTIGDAIGDTTTVNSGAWTFANDTTVALTGGLNGLNFDTNTLSIDAANNRIGIGTAAPLGFLDVTSTTASMVGYFVSGLTTGGSSVYLVNNTGSGARVSVGGATRAAAGVFLGNQAALEADAAITNGWAITTSAGPIIFSIGGAVENGRFHTNGFFGVGDASPLAMFTVGSGDLFQVDSAGRTQMPAGAVGAGTLALSFTADTNTGLYRSAAEEIMFATNGADQFSIGQSFTQHETATATTPTCTTDAQVGTITKYTKTVGATISMCLCTKLATAYSLTALGTGDCT